MEDYKEEYELGSIVTAKRTYNGEIITGEFGGFHLLDKSNPKSIVGVVHTSNGSYDVKPNSIKSVISEDERIRKAVIEFVKQNKSFTHCKGVSKDDCLSWLEKQGEHANFRNKIQIGDEVTRNEDGALVNLSQFKRMVKQGEQSLKEKVNEAMREVEEKAKAFTAKHKGETSEEILAQMRGEQKPAENKGMNLVEEEMTPFQKKVFFIIDTAIEEEQGLKQVCDELLRLAHDEIMQNPAWSEEDERMCQETIDWFEKKCFPYALESQNPARESIKWLKSIKERMKGE